MDLQTCERIGDALYASILRLVDDLAPDRPDLARALYKEARHGGAHHRAPNPPPLRPALYAALDAGIIDAQAFDRLMVYRSRARARPNQPRPPSQSMGSPSDSESSGSGSVGTCSTLVGGASERK